MELNHLWVSSPLQDLLLVTTILFLPVGAFVLRKHRRNARGVAKFALNLLTAISVLAVPLLAMVALMVVIDFADTLWQIVNSELRWILAGMMAFAALLTTMRLIRGPDKVLRLRP